MKTSNWAMNLRHLAALVLGITLASNVMALSSELPAVVPVPALNNASAVPAAPDLKPYMDKLEEIKRTQRETLELKQQLDVEKLRTDLLKQRGGKQPSGASPYILALIGSNNQRQARLMFPGYGKMIARPGDVLPDGWRIDAITDHAVLARQGSGKRVQLPFYAN